MGFKTTAFIATASVLLASAPAFATTFTFDSNNLGSGNNVNNVVGYNKSITTSFNNEDDLFKWSATFKEKNGMLADGAWLVVNDGPNPKGHGGESVIFYLDGGAEKKVSMFTYSGQNNSASYSSGTYLGSTSLLVSDLGDERTFSFEHDMTEINNRTDLGSDWKGTAFANKLGIWHHGADGLTTKYEKGQLESFTYEKAGWYDVDGKDTAAVPEPTTTAALGLFAIAGAFVKRKQSA